MSDINKFTTKEVLNKVLLDSSGNSVAANSHTSQEALNAVLDTSNNRLNVSLGGSNTISGDVTITGDLTVQGGGSLSFDEIVQGTQVVEITNTEALLVRKASDGGDVFIVDTTNSRVGVGVAPSHELTVNNQIGIKRDGTDAFGTLTFDSSGLVLDQSASGYSPLKIKSNGSEIARFTSTGLGIGDSSPDAILDVDNANSTSSTIVHITDSDTGAGNHTALQFNNTTGGGSVQAVAQFNTVGTDLKINAVADLVLQDTGANLGVGTASPAFTLDLTTSSNNMANFNSSNSTGGTLRFAQGGNNKFFLGMFSSISGSGTDYSPFLLAETGLGLSFGVNGTANKVMTLSSSGNVGIGGDPVAQLTLTGATSPSLAFEESNEGTHDKLWLQSVFEHDLIHQVRFDNNGGGNQYMVINRDQLKINSITFKTGGQVTTASTSVSVFKLDDNSRISLSNNDNNTGNTVFGSNAFNASSDNDSDFNTVFGYNAMATGTVSGATHNVAIGASSLNDMTSGDNNVAIGSSAMLNATTIEQSVAIGRQAMGSGVATGSGNVAIGYASMFDVTSGQNNIGIGSSALENVLGGNNNIAIGVDSGETMTGVSSTVLVGKQAGQSINNADALGTVAIGHQSLKELTSGAGNTAVGYTSADSITTGASNTVLGYSAFVTATDTSKCVIIGRNAGDSINSSDSDGTVCIGFDSGQGITSGVANTAVGFETLKTEDNGDRNTAIGYKALTSLNASSGHGETTAVGFEAGADLSTGTANTFVGSRAGNQGTNDITTGSNNTMIGKEARGSANSAQNQTVIGASATGQADNSVTLGNVDVTAVYMAQDKGATIFASGATFEGSASQTTIDLKATANNYIVGLSNNSGRIDLRPGGTTALTAINNGNVSVTGALSKGSGSFKIDHPLESKKDTHHLVHSFVEAPQADNIYRGKATLSSGSVEINLDTVSGMSEGTFVLLNTDIQCFTSNESDWDAVKGSVSGNILTISCQNTDSTANVSWLVIGERQDDHMKETDWTDENGKVIVEPEKPEE